MSRRIIAGAMSAVEAGDTHIEECYAPHQGRCPARESGAHRWSGWPGAHCLDCGEEHMLEACIGQGCRCPCHDALWEGLAQAAAAAEPAADGEDPFAE